MINATHDDTVLARRGEFFITRDADRLDAQAIFDLLKDTYWSENITRERVAQSLRHSCCFGLFRGERQVGFARVVTDFCVFAYVCDVVIHPDQQNLGLGTWLMHVLTEQKDLLHLRRWMLATRDAHNLYRKVGFTPLQEPQKWMTRGA